jgi:predicted RNase H-like HicB family nuclease
VILRHCANLREVKKNARAYDSKAYEMKLGVTVRKEGKWYIAADPVTGVASQGKTCDEALRNFEEAFGLWFECAEEWER